MYKKTESFGPVKAQTFPFMQVGHRFVKLPSALVVAGPEKRSVLMEGAAHAPGQSDVRGKGARGPHELRRESERWRRDRALPRGAAKDFHALWPAIPGLLNRARQSGAQGTARVGPPKGVSFSGNPCRVADVSARPAL